MTLASLLLPTPLTVGRVFERRGTVDAAAPPTLEELRACLATSSAKRWLPAHLGIVDAIPETSVAELDAEVLRSRSDHVELP